MFLRYSNNSFKTVFWVVLRRLRSKIFFVAQPSTMVCDIFLGISVGVLFDT